MRTITKLILPVAMLLLVADFSFGQGKPLSPKETVDATVSGVKTKIVYCRPSARGRKMLGGKEPYGQVWRTGANEATTITFDKPVKIEGKDLAAGTYALFTIPGENEWTIIFNKNAVQFGAFDYREGDDALRVKVKPTKTKDFVETFTIKPGKDEISLDWENTHVAFKVKS